MEQSTPPEPPPINPKPPETPEVRAVQSPGLTAPPPIPSPSTHSPKPNLLKLLIVVGSIVFVLLVCLLLILFVIPKLSTPNQELVTGLDPLPTRPAITPTQAPTQTITLPPDINWVQSATPSYNLISNTDAPVNHVVPGTTYTATFTFANESELNQADPVSTFYTQVDDHFMQLSPNGSIGAKTLGDLRYYPPIADGPMGSISGLIVTQTTTFQLVSWTYETSWPTFAHDDTPITCPCTITFSVFISDPVPMNQAATLPTPTPLPKLP